MAAKVHLVIIDPQNDFMGEDDGSPYTVQMGSTKQMASLPVPGAVSDMRRTGALVERLINKWADIHVTLDSHRVIDVAHPAMWRDSQGNSPAPFTIITNADIQNGFWTPRNPAFRSQMLKYTSALEVAGNYMLMIWPEHCLIGGWGHNVQADLAQKLQQWERKRFATVDYVVKGTNIFTEHYGALMAEVPDPSDQSTVLNAGFIQVLQAADIIAFTGEASSHCVKATIGQIAEHIGDEHLKKCFILTDCTSPVIHPAVDFPAITQQFFGQMAQRGMTLTTSVDFLT